MVERVGVDEMSTTIDDESAGIEDKVLVVIVAESTTTDVVPIIMELKVEKIDDMKCPVVVMES